MPQKKSGHSNDKLWFTLPSGANDLLDQLVDTQEVGGSHSEVIRYLVESQLQEFLDKGRITRRAGKKAQRDGS